MLQIKPLNTKFLGKQGILNGEYPIANVINFPWGNMYLDSQFTYR